MDYARKYRHTSLTLILDFETLLKTFGMRQQKFVTEIHHDGEQKVKGPLASKNAALYLCNQTWTRGEWGEFTTKRWKSR